MPPSFSDEPRYKGTGIKSFVAALSALRGDDVVARVIARLPADFSEAWSYGKVLASGWYPLRWYAALHASAQVVTSEGPLLSRAVGAEAMRQDMSGVYRLLLFVMSPQRLLGQAARAFGTYYTHGTMRITDSGSGFANAVWEGCRGFDGNLWMDVLGSCETAMALCGAKDLRARFVNGGREGDQTAELRALWK